jgi:Tol biopolymer transport system component
MRIRIIAIGMLLLLSAALTAAMQSGNDLYQQGLARETAGDIKGAVQIFERIVRDFSSNRALTARALVQLGKWSDLLGQEQARKHYERVVREFSDQKEAAAEARTRLEVLVKVAAAGTNPARRLVVDQNVGGYTKLTRDGRHLLRYNPEERAFELAEVGTSEVRRITADGPNPADTFVAGSELSRDGRRLAVVVGVLKPRPRSAASLQIEYERAELRLLEVGGRGTGRVLATWDAPALSRSTVAVQPFAWAPRDERIWLFILRSDQSAQIASVDMSGKLQVLKTLTWRDHTQPPSLSPDGRFVAYHDTSSRQASPDLYIIATDGSHEQRIEHPAGDSKPMFLPDGSGVVFVSDRRGAQDLWFLAVKDGQPVGQPRLVWRNVGFFGQAERFADNGSLAYYFSVSDSGTYTLPLDLNSAAISVGEPTRLAPMVHEANSGAAFSPDGRYLAHFRTNAARIVIRELATGTEREIPFGAQLGAGYATADWCSSGDVLIASGYVGGAVAYRVNVKDASVQRLSVAPGDPRFTLCVGDGEEIIYVASGSVVRRSLASGRETTLFNGNVRAVTRSMDGGRLAVVAVDPNGDGYRLVTMSATGGDVSADLLPSGTSLEIKVDPQYTFRLSQNVVWMPGGDRLLAVLFEKGASVVDQKTPPLWLWEVPLTGAAPRKLAFPKVAFWGALTVHPDGKQLAFQTNEGSLQQTWAIDNLAQFIKAGGGW